MKRILFSLIITEVIMTISILLAVPFTASIETSTSPYKDFIVTAGNQIKIEEEIIEEKEPLKDVGNTETFRLQVDPILQNPELPTGCEVTSLATVLNFYGYETNKIELSDTYLSKAKPGEASPYVAFIGNPKSKSGYGCYAPVIAECANNYLNENNTHIVAHNVSGSEFTEFEKYVYNGMPVIIWQTINMVDPYVSTTWKFGKETVEWIANEHATVLIGWNKDNYIFADPLKGIVEYNKSKVIQRYNELGKQAVVIY